MKKIILALIAVLIVIVIAILSRQFSFPPGIHTTEEPEPEEDNSNFTSEISEITIVAENLDTPWGIVILPDKSMLVTERPGRVRLVDDENGLQPEPAAVLPSVKEIGEGGLLGIALHPDFSLNGYVYLYYTYAENIFVTLNRVVQMKYENGKLSNEKIIVDEIPGAGNHNGGRIKFSTDGYLYITTGDAEDPSQAQNISSLAGKILRVTDDGRPADGNPFNNLVYSYGHRNPQGLAWDSKERLWSTEHGPSGGSFGTGNDEINLIYPGRNYGWPVIKGDETKEGMEAPVLNSGSGIAWAPAGLAITGDSLFWGGLRGTALYQGSLNEEEVNFTKHFDKQFGRIRDVVIGFDNFLYITTSNKDGRGNPDGSDDKIIKIDHSKF